MATLSELVLKVAVDSKELKKLSSDLGRVSAQTQEAAAKGSRSFKDMRAGVSALGVDFRTLAVRISAAAAALTGFIGLSIGFKELVSEGIRFNATMEQARLGIAAILTSTQEVVDAQERQLQGAEKFAASVDKASELMERLQVINLQTAATTEQITAAFQAILAPASSANLTLDETLELTKLIVQATSAMGLGMQQTAQEARDLVQGTIDMNSQIARSLGITSDMVKQWREQGVLFEKIKEYLEGFELAGKRTQSTWEAVTSNLKGAIARVSGEAFRPVFDFLKAKMQEWTDALISVENGQIRVNEKLVEAGRVISEVIVGSLRVVLSVFEAIKDVVAAIKNSLDAVAGGLSSLAEKTKEFVIEDIGGTAERLAQRISGFLQKHGVEVAKSQEDALKILGLRGEQVTREQQKQQEVVLKGLESLKDAAKELERAFMSAWKPASDGAKNVNKEVQSLNDSLKEQIEQLKFQVETFGKSEEEIIKYESALLLAKGANKDLVAQHEALRLKLLELKTAQEEANAAVEQAVEANRRLVEIEKLRAELTPGFEGKLRQIELDLEDTVNKILSLTRPLGGGLIPVPDPERFKEALDLIQLAHIKATGEIQKAWKETQEEAVRAQIEQLKASGSFIDGIRAAFLEFIHQAKTSSQVAFEFVADTLGRIRDSFADLIFNTLKGNFDSLKDFWKQTLDAMLRIFSQFVAAVVATPIIINVGARLFGLSPKGIAAQGAGLFGSGIGLPAGLMGALGNFGAGFTTSPFVAGGLFGPPAGPEAFSQFAQAGVNPFSTAFTLGQLALLGAPLIGAGLGFLTGGVPGAVSGGLGGLGFLGGTIAGGAIGGTLGSFMPVIGTIIGSIIGSLLGSLFKDKKKFELEVSGAVEDILRGQGLIDTTRVGQEMVDVLIQNFQGVISSIASTLGFAPELVNELLQREIELEGGGKFADPEKAAKNLEAFITGGFIRPLMEQISDLFVTGLEDLGVPLESAQHIVEAFGQRLEDIKEATKDWEDRAKRGELMMQALQEFLQQITAIQVIMGESVPGEIEKMVASVNALAEEIGFSGIPSLEQLRDAFLEVIESADFPPEIINKFLELRNTIVQLTISIAQSIQTLVSMISELNTAIVSLGGVAVDVSGSLLEAASAIQAVIEAGGLTPEQELELLGMMKGLVDAWVQQQLEAQRQVIEAQQEAIKRQIDALEDEKDRIREAYRERIDALRDELRVVQDLERLAQDIKDNILDILLGTQSIENVFQRLQRAQEEINKLFAELATATPEEMVEIGRKAQDLLNQLLALSGEAFQQPSLEFRDQFRSVIEQLETLAEMVEPARSAEEILSEIERLQNEMDQKLASIDARIEALRAQSEALSKQALALQGQAAEQARAFYEFIREHAIELLNQRLEQLGQIGAGEFTISQQMLSVEQAQLNQLQQINSGIQALLGAAGGSTGGSTGQMGGYLSGVIPAQHGFMGIVRKPTLFLAGEAGPERVHIQPIGRASDGVVNITVNLSVNGNIDSKQRIDELISELEKRLRFSFDLRRRLRLNG